MLMRLACKDERLPVPLLRDLAVTCMLRLQVRATPSLLMSGWLQTSGRALL